MTPEKNEQLLEQIDNSLQSILAFLVKTFSGHAEKEGEENGSSELKF